ncbi:MAG: tetratricopeptide repeat protein [Bacteroidetes bacterium]|nr:tetratricopeptide repeat protein [Bacteroidota bacterium]
MKVKATKEVKPAKSQSADLNLPWYLQWRNQVIFLIVLVFAVFGISVLNEYALDDFILIVKNSYTQQGFAGIKNILTKDTFAGMSEGNVMVLAGGRYRPLSVISFAMEHQFFNGNPHISHFVNIASYAAVVVALLWILRNIIFRNHPLVAFFVAAIFAIHPLHTETVANIKGRDDIFCLLFFFLSVIWLYKYLNDSKTSHLLISTLFFFLSLLSKEFGVALFFLIPITLLIFTNSTRTKSLSTYLPHFIAMLVFVAMRYSATVDNGGTPSNDVFNNPWFSLSFTDKYGTIFSTWLVYLRNMFVPLNMSYDYNFAHVDIVPLTNFYALISIVIHLTMAVYAAINIKKQPLIAYGIIFYFISFGLVSNLLFNIGATMADRFMFIPSVGFLIALAGIYILVKEKYAQQIKVLQISAIGLAIICISGSSVYSAIRCTAWKNNNSLFKNDVHHVPKSVKANLNAGIAYLDTLDAINTKHSLENAKYYLQKGIAMKPDFLDGYLNMGVIYNWQQNNDSALWWWLKAREVKPGNSTVNQYLEMLANPIIQKGLDAGAKKDFAASISYFEQALKIDNRNAETLYNIGGAYYSLNDFANAEKYWQQCLAINPLHQQAKAGLNAATNQLQLLKIK